jgi:hypothetical protein
MNTQRISTRILFPLLLFILGAHVACSGVVDKTSGVTGISQNDAKLMVDDYDPQAGPKLARYKGAEIELRAVSNKSKNTRSWSYPSSDGRFWYRVEKNIGFYFKGCFQKALMSAGATAYDVKTRAEVPKLTVTCLYITDSAFKAEVTLENQGATLTKIYDLTWKPPAVEDRGVLAYNAYRYMDHIVLSVFSDPEFTSVFFRK